MRAKTALTEANLRLVVSFARSIIKRRETDISFEDACQEGILGLTKACEQFDPDRGVRFSTYAAIYIKRSIHESVLSQGRMIRIPYIVGMKISQLKITELAMKDELGREPTDQEIADRMEISMKDLKFYRTKSLKPYSLDKKMKSTNFKGSVASTGGEGERGQDFDNSYAKFVGDPGADPLDLASNEMMRNDVRRLITTLSPKEQAVIRLRFGVDNGKSQTLKYIAEKFKAPISIIRQVEKRALTKLKHPYRSNSVKCYISEL